MIKKDALNQETAMPIHPGKWKEFWSLLSGQRPALWIVIAAVGLAVIETVLSLLVPLFTMDMVNQLSAGSMHTATIVLMISVFIFQAVTSGFAVYIISYVGEHIVARLRDKVWQHLLRLPVPFFDRNTSGEMMSRVTHDTNVIKDFITGHIITFLSGIISIAGAVILLFSIDWKITLFTLLAVPVAMLILWPIGAKMYNVSKGMQQETALFQGDLGRVLSEIRLVKSSLAESLEQTQGKKRISHLFRYGLKEARIMAIVSPLMMSVIMILLVVLIGYGGVRVAAGTLSGGALVAIILYMFQVVVPFTQMASFFTQFQKALGASDRIIEILREETEESSDQKAEYYEKLPAERFNHPLCFESVSFGYALDKQILHNIDLTIEGGRVTAFVGPSGVGKTTLFSLIERFYEPTAGKITYGGKSIETYPMQEWRNRIAYVFQDSPMMAGTIRDNLTYGLSDVDQDRIKKAVEQANLSTFIESLELGYDTEIGERGVKLSGGQRQRLAIARAILRDPEILLLDEATAHLDSASEQLVQEALQVLMRDRTTLIIAHRLSTVRNADQIVVLEGGSITGKGTHEELMSSHPFYLKLVQQQFEFAS